MEKNPTPTIKPAGGAFNGPAPVELVCANPKAAIRYALDGTVPLPGSPLYVALELTESATLTAKAFGGGMKNSGVARAEFDIAEPEIEVGPPVFTVPDTISPNGDVDVSAALKAWLATVPDGSVIAFQPGGQYWHESILLIENRNNLTLKGNGATVLAKTDGRTTPPDEAHKHLWPRQRSHVELENCANILIAGLNARGANPRAGTGDGAYVEDIEGQHGFDIRGSSRVTLFHCGASDTYGDLVYFAGGSVHRITGGYYARSGRQGFGIVDTRDFLAEDFYVGEIGRTVIDFEPTENQTVDGAVLRRGTFGTCRHLLINSGGAGNVGNVTVEHCTIGQVGMKTRCAPSPRSPEGRRRGPHAYLYNTALHAPGPQPPFRFEATDGVRVIGNVARCEASRAKVGVVANGCTGIEVEGNDFGDAIGDLMVDGVVAR